MIEYDWIHWEAGLCNRVSQYRWPIHQLAFHLVPCSDPQRPDNCRRSIQGFPLSKTDILMEYCHCRMCQNGTAVRLFLLLFLDHVAIPKHSETTEGSGKWLWRTVTPWHVRMNSQALSQHKKTYQHQHPRNISHLKHLPDGWRRSDRERGSCGSIPRETQHSHTVVGPSCANHRNNIERQLWTTPLQPRGKFIKKYKNVYRCVQYCTVHYSTAYCKIVKLKLV